MHRIDTQPEYTPPTGLLRVWPTDHNWVVQEYARVQIDARESQMQWVAISDPMSHSQAYEHMEYLRRQQ